MTWELKHVEDRECKLDDSGLYVTIHRLENLPDIDRYTSEGSVTFRHVRADLMQTEHETGSAMTLDVPIVSFQGTASAVRKAIVDYIGPWTEAMSPEHVSYIGAELMRAALTPGFVQD